MLFLFFFIDDENEENSTFMEQNVLTKANAVNCVTSLIREKKLTKWATVPCNLNVDNGEKAKPSICDIALSSKRKEFENLWLDCQKTEVLMKVQYIFGKARFLPGVVAG